MKAKRFTIVEKWIRWYPAGPMEMPQADGKYILATDADRLEAAISRKDEALRLCLDAMHRYDVIVGTTHFTHPHLGWSDEDAVAIKAAFAAAKAALEET